MSISRITILSQIDTLTGYGQVMLNLFNNLERLGYYVSLRPVTVWDAPGHLIPNHLRARFVHAPQPEDWEMIIGVPWTAPTPGKKTIHFTMWETTRPKVEWIHNLNKMSVIIVPSIWNKKAFMECGVRKPIYIVPLGYNASEFWPTQMNMQGPCVFGTAGRLSHGRFRKGTEAVIDCFKSAFGRTLDVKLVVKLHPDCPQFTELDPRIWVFRQNWDVNRIQRFVSGITCFASAARGEGWGLWQHQSMVTGRPVIAAIYGGLAEFMTSQNSYPVSFTEEPSGNEYQGGGDWAKIDKESMIHQMRRVYCDREEARHKGEMAAQDVAHLTWEHSAKMVADVCKYVAESGKKEMAI